MDRDDIIRMAREAGLCIDGEVAFSPNHNGADVDINDLQTFANLVAAAECERIKWNSIHSCHADCQNPACVIVREAVVAEREACALEVEKAGMEGYGTLAAAAAIRARGQNGL